MLSPDGTAIFDRGPNLVRPLDGSNGLSAGGGQVTDWSRDGQHLLVVGPGLNQVDLATGAETQLLDGNVAGCRVVAGQAAGRVRARPAIGSAGHCERSGACRCAGT